MQKEIKQTKHINLKYTRQAYFVSVYNMFWRFLRLQEALVDKRVSRLQINIAKLYLDAVVHSKLSL
jgi:hypothetical protein